MANEIYISSQSGLNITCQLYVAAATVGATFNATEIGTTGDYFTYIPLGIPYGYYLLIAFNAGVKVASGTLYWDGTREISPLMYEELHRLQGLDALHAMTVTTNSRVAGDINLQITGDGVTTSTVQRL
jgi:hypothetical protein